MTYSEFIQLYFERSDALQSYWTLYVVIIGGLLAFSSLRTRPDILTTVLISVLFCLFAYKNLGAIHDATVQRLATLEAIKQYNTSSSSVGDIKPARSLLEPTLNPPAFEEVMVFHLLSDLLTLVTLWAMEYRRRRIAKSDNKASD